MMAIASPLELSKNVFSTVNITFLPLSSTRRAKVLKSRAKFVTLATVLNGAPSVVHTEPLRVAFQGAPGAYSEFAAKTACPNSITIPCRTFSEAILAVEVGYVDRAVLPVESTMEGSTVRNYDLLLCHSLRIVQEINLFVHYCLLAIPGVRKGELKRVISHPMALAHCGKRLMQLGLDKEPVEDTAGAVELLLSHHMLDTAVIASSRAALLYGLDVVAQGLQDESWNVTRFLILSKDNEKMNLRTCRLKTSMVVGHHGGTLQILLRVLSAFSSRNISLTKLELDFSAEGEGPIRILDVHGRGSLEEFPHVLYVDFEGSVDEEKVKEAVDEIGASSSFVRILGCYAADTNVYDLQ